MKKSNRSFYFFVFLFMIFGLFFLNWNFYSLLTKNNTNETVYAEENKQQLPFTVMPILPQNQLMGVKNYFDIPVKGNDVVYLNIEIDNLVDRPLQIEMYSLNGLTSPTGNTQYLRENHTEKAYFTNLIGELAPIIQLPSNTILLNPKEKKQITVAVKAPNLEEGQLIGGISIAEKTKVEKEKKKLAFTIENRVMYTLGIRLNYLKNNAIHTPPKMVIKNVGLDSFHDKKLLNFRIENQNPIIANNVVGEVEIYKKKNKKIDKNERIYHGTFGGFKMAPMTGIVYDTKYDASPLKKGTYVVLVKLNADGNTYLEEMDYKKTTPSEIKHNENNSSLNSTEKQKKPSSSFATYVGLMFMFLLTLGTGILVGWRIKKRS